MSCGEFFSMARKKRCEMTKEELDRVRQQDRDRQRRRREQLHGNEENTEESMQIRTNSKDCNMISQTMQPLHETLYTQRFLTKNKYEIIYFSSSETFLNS